MRSDTFPRLCHYKPHQKMETSHHSAEFPHMPSQAVAQPHCVLLSPLVPLWMSFGCSSILRKMEPQGVYLCAWHLSCN